MERNDSTPTEAEKRAHLEELLDRQFERRNSDAAKLLTLMVEAEISGKQIGKYRNAAETLYGFDVNATPEEEIKKLEVCARACRYYVKTKLHSYYNGHANTGPIQINLRKNACAVQITKVKRDKECTTELASTGKYGFPSTITANRLESGSSAILASIEGTSPSARTARSNLSSSIIREHLDTVLEYAGPDDVTKDVLRITGTETRFAIDKCFELSKSEDYRGWRNGEVLTTLQWDPLPLPADLGALAVQYPPKDRDGNPADNNGKWILRGLSASSSEMSTLAVVLRKSDYYHTKPIQERMHKPVLSCGNGVACTPMQRYGHDLRNYESSPIPSLVCLNVIAVLKDGRLLLTQRISKKEDPRSDWEFGKWSTSFEEQMGSGKALIHPYPQHHLRNPPCDGDFFETIYRGAEEELGTTAIGAPRILSIVMEPYAACVNVLAIVNIDEDIDDIRALWELRSNDGLKELKRVAVINYDFETLLPILAGAPLVLPSPIKPENLIAIPKEEWNLTGRMRLLVALYNKFGSDETRAQFHRYVRSR